MAFDIAAFKTTDALADLALRIANARTDFVATEVLPIRVVPKSHFKWTQFDSSGMYSRDTAKASKAEADKVSFGGFTVTGQAILHKLAADVDPMDARDVDAVAGDLDARAAAVITEQLLVDMEVKAAALVTAAGNYPSGSATSLTTGATTWADAGGDPVQVLKDARVATRAAGGAVPNTMVVSWETMQALNVHPTLIERIKYTGTRLTDADVGTLLGLDRIIVARAQKVATREPTQTRTPIWGDSAIVFNAGNAGTPIGPTDEAPVFGRTFMAQDIYTHRYQDDRRGSGVGRIQVVEMGWEYTQRVVSVESVSSAKSTQGYLIQNTI